MSGSRVNDQESVEIKLYGMGVWANPTTDGWSIFEGEQTASCPDDDNDLCLINAGLLR